MSNNINTIDLISNSPIVQDAVESYNNLDAFREAYASPLQQVFYKQKKHARIYQSIYWGFALLFVFLGTLVYVNSINWACSVYFENCMMIKTGTSIFCLMLALAAFVVGYIVKPEKETVHFLVSKMEKSLKNLYHRQRAALDLMTDPNADREIRKDSIGHHYTRAIEKLHERQEDTLHLLERIASAKEYGIKEREHLFNLAITELHEGLSGILQAFKQKSYSLMINYETTSA